MNRRTFLKAIPSFLALLIPIRQSGYTLGGWQRTIGNCAKFRFSRDSSPTAQFAEGWVYQIQYQGNLSDQWLQDFYESTKDTFECETNSIYLPLIQK